MIQIGNLKLYSVADTAKTLHLTIRGIRALLSKGELHSCRKVGRLLYIDENEIIHWLEAGSKEGNNENKAANND